MASAVEALLQLLQGASCRAMERTVAASGWTVDVKENLMERSSLLLHQEQRMRMHLCQIGAGKGCRENRWIGDESAGECQNSRAHHTFL